jgi:PAS domain S-box-containing protein
VTADHGKMTKAELLRALTALEARRGPESGETARVLHELEVHQEELELQNFELRQTQQLLEDSRDRYAELYDFCPVGYLSLDYAGCIREVNLTAATLFGIERTRLTGKPLAQYIAETDRPRFYSHLGECRNDAPQLKTELKLNTPHGVREVELLTTRPPIANGGSALYRTAITDITERKRAAEALRENEEKLRWLIANMPAVLWIRDEHGGPRYISANVAGVLGYTEQEVRSGGRRFWHANVHPDDRQRVETAYARIFSRDGQIGAAIYDIEYRRSTKDGSWIWVLDRGMSISEEGGARYATGMLWDTTRRKRMQEQLRESEERFRQLAENIDEVFYLTDVEGDQIFYVSPAFEKVWGFSAQKLYQEPRSWQELVYFADRKRVRRAFKARERGSAYDMEFRIARPDGAVRWIRVRGFPISGASGTVFRVAGVARDVTVRKEAAEVLRVSHQRMRELALHLQSVREDERKRIAREIHDELGALLLAIKMDLDACQKRQAAVPDVTAAMQELLGRVDTAIDSVRRIATDLRPSVLDNIGVLAAVEWQAQETERRTGIKCEVAADPRRDDFDLPPELATAIFRIVQEALSNVVRHSRATHVHIALGERADRVELHIADNGKGFGTDVLPDSKSWGLIGMAERVRAFGGEFSVMGAPHEGTAITVTIPVRPSGKKRHSAKASRFLKI